ncbi:MAG TPA: M20/M25/M40 family metallo-hydrolase [Sphingomicrobium sp.]|nr:M20/M25/M40 family metallo-hydrolase [Sphingomicrobium sp.]
MRRSSVLALGVVVLILAALAAKSLLISVPPVQSVPGQFDAVRAKARLAFILGDQRPHPADSAADDAVRARLVATLRQTGLKPIVRDQFVCNDFQKARLVSCARVRNVIAILGPHSGKALLLSAHYDSVPVGPGASDDGVGVATLLEVGSILKDRPLKRPLILLFNEGEELGLIGARAFLADPLSRSVDSVLNFEARGVTGPVTMFETSRPNAAAVDAFASAVGRPFASSLSTDVYHLLPNDTDVTTYNERGWLALNFAMTGNETRYHSGGDDLAGLDPRSLQHMGNQALAVSTELASGLPRARGQRIFMDLVGRGFFQMPLAVGVVLFILLILAFAAIVWRRRAYGRALAAPFAAIVLGSIAGWLASMVMGALRAGTYWRANPEVSYVAIYATVLLGALVVLRTLGARASRDQLRAGTWLVFLLLGALLASAAPGAIIYFLVPPIVVLIGIAASKWRRPAEAVGGLVAILILYLTWGELLALLEVLFSPGPLWIAAPVAAIMMIPVLVEAHGLFGAAHRRVVIAGSAVIALLAWIVVGVTPAYSQQREQRFTIEHVTEFPSRKSYWSVLNDGAPLPAAYSPLGKWTYGKLPFSERERWFAPATPITGVEAPSIQRVEVLQSGSERRIKLRLEANGAERILITAPADTHIRSAGVAGFVRPIGGDESASGKFSIACTGRSCDRAELIIDADTSKPIRIIIGGSSNGLPASAAPLLQARPANARPQYVPDETVTVTRVNL